MPNLRKRIEKAEAVIQSRRTDPEAYWACWRASEARTKLQAITATLEARAGRSLTPHEELDAINADPELVAAAREVLAVWHVERGDLRPDPREMQESADRLARWRAEHRADGNRR